MDKVCKNCIFHGAFIMCCFNDKNEGIRVFNPDKQTCVYFEPINKYKN